MLKHLRKHSPKMLSQDLHARAAEGLKKYGTMLRENNGRDALNDCYEEALDAVMYATQAGMEVGGQVFRYEFERNREVQRIAVILHVAENLACLVKQHMDSRDATPSQ